MPHNEAEDEEKPKGVTDKTTLEPPLFPVATRSHPCDPSSDKEVPHDEQLSSHRPQKEKVHTEVANMCPDRSTMNDRTRAEPVVVNGPEAHTQALRRQKEALRMKINMRSSRHGYCMG